MHYQRGAPVRGKFKQVIIAKAINAAILSNAPLSGSPELRYENGRWQVPSRESGSSEQRSTATESANPHSIWHRWVSFLRTMCARNTRV